MPFSKQQIDAGLQIQPGGTYGLIQNIRQSLDACDKLNEIGVKYSMTRWGVLYRPPALFGHDTGGYYRSDILHFFSEVEKEVAYWHQIMETLVVFLEPRLWGKDEFQRLSILR